MRLPVQARRAWGPSPRVRGAARSMCGSPRAGGTIPAGAGQRNPAWRRGPRQGPSPRVRGADVHRGLLRVTDGTIPAGAGSRPEPGPTQAPRRDHPRGCGEQVGRPMNGAPKAGPSPRVRGAAAEPAWETDGKGTIPAGAGSSRPAPGPRPCQRDYPRGCGEQVAAVAIADAVSGPSPRVRGADRRDLGLRCPRGTIPAGAGSSRSCRAPRCGGGDHPRGCGEQGFQLGEQRGAGGPSPRVRGAEGVGGGGDARAGTIPAGAGSRNWSN
ncbi:hypothetical protein SGLAU_32690 (plasmid) [Streptomyces glaucescens]|uniref:Uncharacterized protein n=1 Tax=Streptomyces glaucescens TaxID=1907 RepID=A0A089XMM9_STRGA|nr:hypothetical protein SGLAU_32690 [Streptomyces glaucescens]